MLTFLDRNRRFNLMTLTHHNMHDVHILIVHVVRIC